MTTTPTTLPTTLDLRGLSETERYDQINIAVALHVAKWTMHRNPAASKCGADIPKGEAMRWENHFVPPQFNGDVTYWRPLPHYSDSLDAVMPLLSGWIATDTETVSGPYSVKIDYHEGRAKTLSLAACYALLYANGVTVLV